MSAIKQTLKKIPGISGLANWWNGLGKDTTRGAWIFKHGRVSWMYQKALVRQLPLPYRWFALFCRIQYRNNPNAKIRFGRQAFQLAHRTSRLFGLPDHADLNLPNCIVTVDLLDARFIQVVHELLSDTSRETLSPFLSKGDTFVDVGANQGGFSVLATVLLERQGLVVAIEPQPRLSQVVRRSLQLNNMQAFQVHQIACGDRSGQVRFFIPAETSGAASVFQSYAGERDSTEITVSMEPFDKAVDWRNFPGRVFIKLDIEGSESSFLEGARQMILSRRPAIMMEINPTSMSEAGVSGIELLELLHSLRYQNYVEYSEPSFHKSLRDLDLTVERNIILLPPEA